MELIEINESEPLPSDLLELLIDYFGSATENLLFCVEGTTPIFIDWTEIPGNGELIRRSMNMEIFKKAVLVALKELLGKREEKNDQVP